MNENSTLAIMIDFDGDNHQGSFSLYPANEESEPASEFRSLFSYGPQGDYPTRDEARSAAENEAFRVACRIGGKWLTNE